MKEQETEVDAEVEQFVEEALEAKRREVSQVKILKALITGAIGMVALALAAIIIFWM